MRPAIKCLARAMEVKLQARESKVDWRLQGRLSLLVGLMGEVFELVHALLFRDDVGVLEEAADVANFALMLFDQKVGAFADRGRIAL